MPPDWPLLITGIGKVATALSLTRRLADVSAPVSEVINIGTAGSLHDHHSGLYLPSTVIEHDISADALKAMGYPVVDRWQLPDGDGTVLASGDTFVADPVHRERLARQADLVDMEGAAIAHVCAAHQVRCRMVKVVSDSADETAMEWPQRVDKAARELAAWLGDTVTRG